MNSKLPTEDAGRHRFSVHGAADIERLIVHLFTHWTLPHVHVHIDSLPAVAVQRAQHHIARISEARNGTLGAGLAATIFLVGIIMAWVSPTSTTWTSRQFWQYLGLLGVAVLYAALIGLGVELVWKRLRLMLLLRRLRRRLVTGATFHEPMRYAGLVSRAPAVQATAAGDDDGVADDNLLRRPVLSRPRRPSVLLHDSADVKRLIIHLFTHWKLPSVRISTAGVAPLDVQRAQHRIARLSAACNCVLGASLAGATLLGGAFAVEWVASHAWDWMVPVSWGPLGLVPVAAGCAALLGWMIEWIWTRVKLLLVLHGVRHRLGA